MSFSSPPLSPRPSMRAVRSLTAGSARLAEDLAEALLGGEADLQRRVLRGGDLLETSGRRVGVAEAELHVGELEEEGRVAAPLDNCREEPLARGREVPALFQEGRECPLGHRIPRQKLDDRRVDPL